MLEFRKLISLTFTAGVIVLASTNIAKANSPNGTNAIQAVTVHDSGHVIVRLNAASNTEGCASPNAVNEILIHKDNPRFKDMYAMALLAFATDRPVYGWVNGCTDVWGNGNNMVPTAVTLTIQKP